MNFDGIFLGYIDADLGEQKTQNLEKKTVVSFRHQYYCPNSVEMTSLCKKGIIFRKHDTNVSRFIEMSNLDNESRFRNVNYTKKGIGLAACQYSGIERVCGCPTVPPNAKKKCVRTVRSSASTKLWLQRKDPKTSANRSKK